jgi:hypothetical protein
MGCPIGGGRSVDECCFLSTGAKEENSFRAFFFQSCRDGRRIEAFA